MVAIRNYKSKHRHSSSKNNKQKLDIDEVDTITQPKHQNVVNELLQIISIQSCILFHLPSK